MIKINKALTTVLIIIICLLISVYYLYTYKKIGEIYQNETENTIIHIKKSFLKNTVENLIYEIDLDRKNEADLYEKHIIRRYETLILTDHLSDEEYVDFFITRFDMDFNKDSYINYWTVLLWDSSNNKILYDPGNIAINDINLTVESLKPLMSHYQIVNHRNIMGFFGVSQEFIDNRIKVITSDKIRSLKFDNGSYIWVNEIINYDGGKDYAIKRVDPDLPETEGMLLSTDSKDIKGNMPYLEELEGIKKDGELYLKYYFKKYGSDVISEKLSFIKSYQDFNWVIGMGVHMDDIQDYVILTNKKSLETGKKYISIFLFFLVVIIIISLTFLLLLKNYNFKKEKRRIEQENNKDALTVAYNRKYGTKELLKSFNDFRDNKANPAIMMFDIDNFKNINDTFGHDVGDNVLIDVVNTVSKSIRSTDTLIRWGGDEFICIFYDLSKEHAMALGEKLRSAVEKKKTKLDNSEINITISIGISFFKKEDIDICDVIKRADIAMYKSKENGKNTVSSQ